MSDPLKDAKVPKPKTPKGDAAQGKTEADDAAEKAKADQLKSGDGGGATDAAPEVAPEVVLPSLGQAPPMEMPMKDGKPLIARRAKNSKRVSWYGSFVQVKAGKVCTVAAYGLPGLASFERQGIEFEDIYEE